VLVKRIKERAEQKGGQQSEILMLHFDKQYGAKEIAEMVEVPHRTVVTTIVRFSREIKDWYDKSMRS